jgi:tetratricopeptide (TPR) repeat protein
MPTELLIVLVIIASGVVLAVIGISIKNALAPRQISHISEMVRTGRTAPAIKACKQILQKDPRNPEAHYFLGLSYLKEAKSELALMEFKTVNDIGLFEGLIDETDFRKQSAELFLRFDQEEEALKEYILLTKMEPEEPENFYQVGLLFLALSKGEHALNYLKKTLELDPRHSNAHLQLGLLLYRAKRYLDSKAELEQALRLDPENYEANYFLGKILKDNNDYQGALKAFEIAQKNPEVKTKALVERGTVFMAMKNYDRAMGELERAVKLSTNDGAKETLFARYFLSVCYEKTRQLDKAIGEWEKIYAKKPTFRDVAEKLSAYQDLRLDDHIKDYVTSGKNEYALICKNITQAMGLAVQDVTEIKNGVQIIALESDSDKWRNTKKMPRLLRFYRISGMIEEDSVRDLHEKMREIGASRAGIITNTQFSRMSINFAETRPLDLFDKDKLQNLLTKIEYPTP